MEARHHSRRSSSKLDLKLLSIKPLTSLPLEVDTDYNARDCSSRRKSYIESRSLPQTPSILSRSNSRSRSGLRLSSKSSHTITDLAMTSTPDTPCGTSTLKSTKSRSRTHSTRVSLGGNDWLEKTASVMALSTAEYKGQTWLSQRNSSTSLADIGHEPVEYAYRADDEFSPVSTIYASRPHSRFGSRVTSRRGSKVGLMTPMGLRTPGERDEQGGYLDDLEVDFVDEGREEDSSEDEGEIKRLVWGRVGGWVDWAVGWMDMRVDEDQDESEEEKVEEASEEAQAKIIHQAENKKKRRTRQDLYYESTKDIGSVPPAPESEGIVGDAAWLLSVAKSALGSS